MSVGLGTTEMRKIPQESVLERTSNHSVESPLEAIRQQGGYVCNSAIPSESKLDPRDLRRRVLSHCCQQIKCAMDIDR